MHLAHRLACRLLPLLLWGPLARPAHATAPPAAHPGDDGNRALSETLTAVTTMAFARHAQLDVLSSADLRAVIALEADKQMLGCDEADNACLAELAGALGARYVVISQVGALERSLVLGLALYDAQSGRALGRELLRAAGLEAVVEQVDPAVQRLVARLPATTSGAASRSRVLVLDLRVPAGFRQPAPASATDPPPAVVDLRPPPPPVLPVAAPPPQREVLPLGGLDKALACVYRAVPRAMQSQDRYASWVDLATGPTCRERYLSYGLYAPYEDARERCAEAVQATARAPAVHVEVQALAQAIDALWPPLLEAAAYYQGQDYLDDGCVRARTLHPVLLQGFAGLQRATDRLLPLLERAIGQALATPSSRDSPQRRALVELSAALHALAQQAPTWRDPAWEPTPSLLAAHDAAQARWRVVQGLAVPQDTLQSTLWKASVAISEPVLTELKRRMRAYRDVEGWKKQHARADLRRFDPEEIREPVHELMLGYQRMGFLE